MSHTNTLSYIDISKNKNNEVSSTKKVLNIKKVNHTTEIILNIDKIIKHFKYNKVQQ